MRGEPGFFDVDDRLRRLSDLGDQLEAFGSAVDFEIFRADLDEALGYRIGPQGGRPPFDPVLMFKILVIQSANNLSDERAEFLINDRLSFMRFLGLGLSDRVPDARTIWLFREKLTKAGAIRGLFGRFDAVLRSAGYIAMSGQIIDASLVAAPKQRNTEDEKKAIKEGRVPEHWKARPGKLRQKDRDARWTVKYSKAKERPDGSKPPVDIAIPGFGYQNHIGIDRGFGLIRTWFASPLVVVLLARPLLGERIGVHRLAAVLVGFAGVLVVTRPGLGGLHAAALLAMGAACCNALYSIATRLVAAHDSSETTLFYTGLVGSLVFLPVLPFVWAWPTAPLTWLLLAALGTFGALGHWLLILAHRRAPRLGAGPVLLRPAAMGHRPGLSRLRRNPRPLDTRRRRHRHGIGPLPGRTRALASAGHVVGRGWLARDLSPAIPLAGGQAGAMSSPILTRPPRSISTYTPRSLWPNARRSSSGTLQSRSAVSGFTWVAAQRWVRIRTRPRTPPRSISRPTQSNSSQGLDPEK